MKITPFLKQNLRFSSLIRLKAACASVILFGKVFSMSVDKFSRDLHNYGLFSLISASRIATILMEGTEALKEDGNSQLTTESGRCAERINMGGD